MTTTPREQRLLRIAWWMATIVGERVILHEGEETERYLAAMAYLAEERRRDQPSPTP